MVGLQVIFKVLLESLSKKRDYFFIGGFSLIKQENYFYIIDNQFFEDFPDPYLRGNHEENRPHYFAFKEENQKIFWIVPISSRIEKYKKIIQSKESQGKPCDILHILTVAGKEEAFLIQDMFPISEEYLKRAYTINGIPLKLVHEKDICQVRKKANKIYNLILKSVRFSPTQPNVLAIRDELLKKIFSDELYPSQEIAATKEES